MSIYFGFMPIDQPGSCFISYNSEDANRVFKSAVLVGVLL